MTRAGRTTPHRGRDRTMREDPGATNKYTVYPGRSSDPAAPTQRELSVFADQPIRPGCAERQFQIAATAAGATPFRLHLSLAGWFTDRIELDERAARYLLDFLTMHLHIHDRMIAPTEEST